jgi:ATP-dependent Clp protease protease subunit
MSDTIKTLRLPNPMDRKIFFGKQVDQASIEEIIKKIISINEDDSYLTKLYILYDLEYCPKPIEIYIDTYGGHVYQILGLVSVMEKSKTVIHTIATGAAMSCGFIMLIFGHKRFCYEHATIMYHQISSGVRGKIEDMEQEVIHTKRLQDKIEEFTLRRTKISKEKIDQIRKEKIDWFIDAEEAKKLKVIDEIL